MADVPQRTLTEQGELQALLTASGTAYLGGREIKSGGKQTANLYPLQLRWDA